MEQRGFLAFQFILVFLSEGKKMKLLIQCVPSLSSHGSPGAGQGVWRGETPAPWQTWASDCPALGLPRGTSLLCTLRWPGWGAVLLDLRYLLPWVLWIEWVKRLALVLSTFWPWLGENGHLGSLSHWTIEVEPPNWARYSKSTIAWKSIWGIKVLLQISF